MSAIGGKADMAISECHVCFVQPHLARQSKLTSQNIKTSSRTIEYSVRYRLRLTISKMTSRSKTARYWTSRSKKLGRQAHVVDRDEVLISLKAAIERAGSRSAFAKSHGLDGSYVSLVMNGKCGPGPLIIRALGLRVVYELLA
jgi:hypothetical protein